MQTQVLQSGVGGIRTLVQTSEALGRLQEQESQNHWYPKLP